MYNNIENIVNRIFQNYYDISVNVSSQIILNNENLTQQRDISSARVAILMESIFDNRNRTRYNNDNSNNDNSNNDLFDISLSAYRLQPTYYYSPTNYVFDRPFYVQNNSFINLINSLSQNYTSQENSFLENFINSTFVNNKEKFKKVISDYELEKLKTHIFIKQNETTTNCQCPIFCYNFEENEEIIKLPCNHNFNREGIIKWLTQESNTCPVCRYEFDYKEINSDNKRQDTSENNNEENEENEDNEDNDYYNENYENNDEENNEDTDYNTNIYDNISEEELILQEILLYTYSNSNRNINNTIT
jgi:hypothetical protein